MPDMYTLYTVYLVQIVATGFLAVLLARFHHAYGHSYLREWSRSWAMLCVYVSGGLLAVAWTSAYPPQHVVRLSVAIVSLIAGYTQVAFLLFGTYSVARNRPASRTWRNVILVACAILAVILALMFTGDPELGGARFFVRIGIRGLVAGAAYLAAGIWLARNGGWRRGYGRAIVLGAFILYGVEQLNYFAFNALDVLGLRVTGGGLALLGFVDLLLQFAMGLGMVVWLLEEERDELARTGQALQRSEERLRRSQRLESIGKLAGGVAHDFNNLLTIISGRGQRLLGRLPARSDEWEDARQIDEAAERGAVLVRQLLAFSRRQVLIPRPVHANEVVRSVRSMLRRSLGEEITFDCQLAPDLGWALVDPAQLEHVLVNLALNARDAMPGGGVLTMTTSNVSLSSEQTDSLSGISDGEHIEIAVHDNGMGMDDEIRPQIFDPFYTTKEVGKGTGLGLATVYGIVRQSGGVVEVESSPGKGTTFRVVLPRTGAPPADVEDDRVAPEEPEVERVADTSSRTVLVVEDDERIRGLLDTVLRDNGYEVTAARNGVEALDLAAELRGDLDLLLTDVVMPGLGGPELADQLAERNPHLKVLFMSGYSEEIVAARLAGPARMLLEKPFSLTDLLDNVRVCLDD